ncbi:MAG: hypothetical protein K2X87_09230 [Gemmataceae bacterium]|nr:hypothetical protein [Gemmataceae bacterium]
MEHADKALPGGHQITLFGQAVTLRPNMLTFCTFQQLSGKNPMDPLTWVNLPPDVVVWLVLAALGGEESGRTFKEVAAELEFATLREVNQFVVKFFEKGSAVEPPKPDAAG